VALLLAVVLGGLLAFSGSTVIWPGRDGGFARTGLVEQGMPGRVSNYSLLWKFRAGLCVASSPVVGDFDGNGVVDVSFAACDGYEYTLYGTNGSVEWRVRTGGGLTSPAAADLDGDGRAEIVVGGALSPLFCISHDGRVMWEVRGLFEGAVPVVGDFDGDGRLEVAANSFDGRVAIVDGASGGVEWFSRVGTGAVSPLASGDVTGDGLPDIVGISGRALFVVYYNGGNYSVATLRLPDDGQGYPALYDVDGDGVLDIIASYTGGLEAVSYSRGLLWRAPLEGSMENSVAVGDVLHTGTPQVVAATSSGIFVYSLNGSLLEEIRGYDASYASPLVGDFDGDGLQELLVAGRDGTVLILNASAGSDLIDDIVFELDTGGPIMSTPTVADVNGDGIPDILVPSRDFNLYAYTPSIPGPVKTGTTQQSTTPTPSPGQGTSTTTPKPPGPGWEKGPEKAPSYGGLEAGKLLLALAAGAIIVAAAYLYSRE